MRYHKKAKLFAIAIIFMLTSENTVAQEISHSYRLAQRPDGKWCHFKNWDALVKNAGKVGYKALGKISPSGPRIEKVEIRYADSGREWSIDDIYIKKNDESYLVNRTWLMYDINKTVSISATVHFKYHYDGHKIILDRVYGPEAKGLSGSYPPPPVLFSDFKFETLMKKTIPNNSQFICYDN